MSADRPLRLLLTRLLAVLVIPASGPAVIAAKQAPLHVSAAISLRPALEEAAAVYRARRGPIEIRLNAGGSGVLLQQALRGAPVDLLISASSDEIDRLIEEGIASARSRRTIASNRLVLVTPPGRTVPSAASDLLRPEFARIAVGNPRTAPLGRYTRQALERLQLWDRLGERLVPAENARQVVEYLSRGEVDGAIVYRSDALRLGERVLTGPEVPSELHAPIRYEGIVLSAPKTQRDAGRFLSWLASAEGRTVLVRHGFRVP